MEKSYKVFSIFNLVITVSRGYNSTRFLKFFWFWFVRITKVSLGIGQGKLHSSLVTSKEVLAVWTFVGDCIKWIDATWNAGTTPEPKNWKFVALQTWFLLWEELKMKWKATPTNSFVKYERKKCTNILWNRKLQPVAINKSREMQSVVISKIYSHEFLAKITVFHD